VFIAIAWIGEGREPDGLIPSTVAAVAREYTTRAVHLRLPGRPAGTYDSARGQHSSRTVLAWLAGSVPAGGRLLGVTDVDLFVPVLTFVFGEAQLGGRAAVVSLARLVGADSAVVRERLIKESIHELGHTFGLVHCASPTCVMTRSPGLTAVDRKGPRLCTDCRMRYHELEESSRASHHAHPDR
jgi:archaemetzincin